MGYSEIKCHLCYVSFNIGRIRRINEPMSGGWDSTGCSYISRSRHPNDEYEDGKKCDGEYIDEYEKQERSSFGHQHCTPTTESDDQQSDDEESDEPESDKSESDELESDEPESAHQGAKCMFVNRLLEERRERRRQWQFERGLVDGDGDVNMILDLSAQDTSFIASIFETDRASESQARSPSDRSYDPDADDVSSDEPLEFDSDVEIEDSTVKGSEPNEPRTREAWIDAFYRVTYNEHYYNVGQISDLRKISEIWHPRKNPRSSAPPTPKNVLLEHIAGPNCTLQSAYCGSRISAEEMRGCTTAQCLVRKQPGVVFTPIEQGHETVLMGPDEPFELDGGYFLSGLCHSVNSRDFGGDVHYPMRHPAHADGTWGKPSLHMDNFLFSEERAAHISMPFHPWCLEVYKRVSQHDRRNGHGQNMSAAINDLGSWWTVDAGFQRFWERKSSSDDVQRCAEQWWSHQRGTEYLAANPLFVPQLSAILQSAVSNDPEFDMRNDVFTAHPDRVMRPSPDPFAVLPAELRLSVLSLLENRDIANLRLVSRTFHQLPMKFFYDLVRSEMPWLWEVWGSNDPRPVPYSYWACIDVRDLAKATIDYENQRRSTTEYVSTAAEELPELREELLRRRKEWEDEHASRFLERMYKGKEPTQFPASKMNWYTLYCEIKKNWSNLQGLKNRARIWTDCGNILRLIADSRDQGDFPVTDIPGLVETGYARLREQREAREARN